MFLGDLADHRRRIGRAGLVAQGDLERALAAHDRRIEDLTGDDFDRARMIRGFFLTLELAVITIILSVLVGIAGAWLQGSKFVWIRRIVAGFISFFRNTPPLVQIYFFSPRISAISVSRRRSASTGLPSRARR